LAGFSENEGTIGGVWKGVWLPDISEDCLVSSWCDTAVGWSEGIRDSGVEDWGTWKEPLKSLQTVLANLSMLNLVVEAYKF
jgi:hypothetical protein